MKDLLRGSSLHCFRRIHHPAKIKRHKFLCKFEVANDWSSQEFPPARGRAWWSGPAGEAQISARPRKAKSNCKRKNYEAKAGSTTNTKTTGNAPPEANLACQVNPSVPRAAPCKPSQRENIEKVHVLRFKYNFAEWTLPTSPLFTVICRELGTCFFYVTGKTDRADSFVCGHVGSERRSEFLLTALVRTSGAGQRVSQENQVSGKIDTTFFMSFLLWICLPRRLSQWARISGLCVVDQERFSIMCVHSS